MNLHKVVHIRQTYDSEVHIYLFFRLKNAYNLIHKHFKIFYLWEYDN